MAVERLERVVEHRLRTLTVGDLVVAGERPLSVMAWRIDELGLADNHRCPRSRAVVVVVVVVRQTVR